MKLLSIFILLFSLNVSAGEPFLLFSYSSDRVLPTPLSGAKIDSDFYISVPNPQGTKLTISWPPNNDGITDEYYVFHGIDISTPNKLTPSVLHDPTKFKVFPALPAPYNIEKRVWQSYFASDIPTNAQQNACFRLKSFNVAGESGYSEEVCVTFPQVKNVAFYLDDPGLTMPPMRIKTDSPYDLTGVTFADISSGQHVLVAVINFTQGVTPKRLEAGFEVVKKYQIPSGVQVQQELVW